MGTPGSSNFAFVRLAFNSSSAKQAPASSEEISFIMWYILGAQLLLHSSRLWLFTKSLQASIFGLLCCLLDRLSKVNSGHKYKLGLQSAAGIVPVGLSVMQLLA